MQSISKFVGGVAAAFVATTGVVFAGPTLVVPEPGSIALVALAVGALALVSRKGKK
jgi:4-amino-4-deoxy-L-arabinose transferase-like glycosyltransferase